MRMRVRWVTVTVRSVRLLVMLVMVVGKRRCWMVTPIVARCHPLKRGGRSPRGR